MQSSSNWIAGSDAGRLKKTRRRFLAALSLATLGAASAGPHGAEARKRKKKRKNKNKNNKQNPPAPPVTYTRVTRTFTNTSQIVIPQSGGQGKGPGDPYPAPITVSGMAGGKVRSVVVTLRQLKHAVATDVCILLVKGTANAIVLAGAGSNSTSLSSVTLTFDDTASAPPGQGTITSGRYQPFSYVPVNSLSSVFVAPAPTLSGSTALSVFRDLDPDGAWQLFIADKALEDYGSLNGGWELTVTADVPNP